MGIMDAKVCPRQAFLRNKLPSGVIKAAILRKIAIDVLMDCDFRTIKKEMEKKVDDAFAAASAKMFGFEAESEKKRMKTLLWRYLAFERTQTNNAILTQGFKHDVKVMEQERSVSAHRLIDRGSALECVRYFYKKPVMNYKGRTMFTLPDKNPDLLALQRCGEAQAKILGIDKPVFGSFYHLKGKEDTVKNLSPLFDEHRGENIINYHFEPSEETALKLLYKDVMEDVAVCTDNENTCYDCRFKDLCHTVFDKRKLADMPVAEETPLDKIHMTKFQEKFVRFEAGQCRVNAVAGSGKTTIVTLRTLRLIEEGCPPEQVLMVTFTEKAKGEMRSRLRRYAKGMALKGLGIDTDKVVVETFNSFGQALLTEHYSELGFTKPPELIDEVVKKDIIVQLLEEHPSLPMDYCNPFLDMPNASGAVIQMGHIIDALKANHVKSAVEAEPLLSSELLPFAAEIVSIYEAYNSKLIELNSIDYEDQLRLILQLKPFGVFDALPYQHIVVDEFQDSDANQINLILEMAKAAVNLKSIVVVGDELQAIYGFRNANPDNLVNFGTYFPGMIDIPLEDNFRSQSPIIAMANRILSKEARIAKVIRATRKEKGWDPVLRNEEKLDDERLLYVKQIQKLLRDGTPPKDIAVLCRTKSELIGLQKQLDEAKIPTILRVPEIIANAPYVKAIIGLAAFLLDHENLLDLALFRKSLGQDPFDDAALKKDAEELGKKYDELTTEEERILLFTGLIQDATEDYVAAAFVEEVLTKGFHTARQIFEFCVKYRDYSIKETISTAREDVDAVTLITVHSAKGLEWPVVLLSLRKFKAAKEEEHRLLYVAITRAKEKLLITYTKKQKTLVALLD